MKINNHGGYVEKQMKFDLYIPENFEALLKYLAANGKDAVFVAGGSDLMPRIKRRLVKPKLLVDLSSLRELDYVKQEDGCIRIGALATISELSESTVLSRQYEAFRQVAARYGGPAIRNIATIGGNVAAAASSEDLIPVLLALDATIHTTSARGTQARPLREFLVGKRRTSLSPDELITEISFRALNGNSWCTFEKVGRRNSLIIALVSLAVCMEIESDIMKVNDIRVAFNRFRGRIPERAIGLETALRGRSLNEETIAEGVRVLDSELALTSDYRASSEYRVEAAKACLRKAVVHCAEQISSLK